jgi:hypothetical protein
MVAVFYGFLALASIGMLVLGVLRTRLWPAIAIGLVVTGGWTVYAALRMTQYMAIVGRTDPNNMQLLVHVLHSIQCAVAFGLAYWLGRIISRGDKDPADAASRSVPVSSSPRQTTR